MLRCNNKWIGIIACVLAIGLTACQKKLDYDYLMQHPKILKKEWDKCQSGSEKNEAQRKHCDLIRSAAEDFTALLAEQQAEPEGFGQRIMSEQAQLLTMRAQYKASANALKQLRAKHATKHQLRIAEMQLTKDQNAYRNKRKQVKILLAVISVNSPE